MPVKWKYRAKMLELELQNQLWWHEAQDKALSKQPNANVGQSGWMRIQHKEQIDRIRELLDEPVVTRYDAGSIIPKPKDI